MVDFPPTKKNDVNFGTTYGKDVSIRSEMKIYLYWLFQQVIYRNDNKSNNPSAWTHNEFDDFVLSVNDGTFAEAAAYTNAFIIPETKLLLTNINPAVPARKDIFVTFKILQIVYHVDKNKSYDIDFYDHYDCDFNSYKNKVILKNILIAREFDPLSDIQKDDFLHLLLNEFRRVWIKLNQKSKILIIESLSLYIDNNTKAKDMKFVSNFLKDFVIDNSGINNDVDNADNIDFNDSNIRNKLACNAKGDGESVKIPLLYTNKGN